jgi:2-polyprenyl-3-methyl-5-hydroxy-6-metoxy-1,4-benzoquinol methylase
MLEAVELLEDKSGRVIIGPPNGRQREVRAEPRNPNVVAQHSPCLTTYSDELIRLIFEAYGSLFTCDEISRDVDETEAALDVRYSVLAYFDESIFARPLRILDYGCGSGSSILALARMFPHASITGVDFVPSFLKIAQLRAEHYGHHNVTIQQVPTSGRLENIEPFDVVFLNAVYEHLLPPERPAVLQNTWSVLKPGGALILNQTPHRWFPIETHTSGLPLINYLPEALTRWAVRRFGAGHVKNRSWEELLRAGIRGGSIREIMQHLKRIDPNAVLLKPSRLSSTWAGIWYAAKRARLSKVGSSLVKSGVIWTERLVRLTRVPLSPYVNIAVTKGPSRY